MGSDSQTRFSVIWLLSPLQLLLMGLQLTFGSQSPRTLDVLYALFSLGEPRSHVLLISCWFPSCTHSLHELLPGASLPVSRDYDLLSFSSILELLRHGLTVSVTERFLFQASLPQNCSFSKRILCVGLCILLCVSQSMEHPSPPPLDASSNPP